MTGRAQLGGLIRPTVTGDDLRDRAATRFEVYDVPLTGEEGPAVIVAGVGHDHHELVRFVTNTDVPLSFRQYPGLHSVVRIDEGRFAWRNDELVDSPRGVPATVITEVRKSARVDAPSIDDEAPAGLFESFLLGREAA
ncbi:hypothetical protein ACFVAJ_19295 [Agromyces sp. NPDC057679]|uniref:hypothetical protein n=1 Tax=Agromyces sp. NPDC057679 TaxID=3346207 RepID=UPI00366F68DD